MCDYLWRIENLLENTENSVKLQEVKVVPNITKNIVSVGLLLQDGAEIEENLLIVNIKYKGIIMKFRRSEKYGIYYLCCTLTKKIHIVTSAQEVYNNNELVLY